MKDNLKASQNKNVSMDATKEKTKNNSSGKEDKTKGGKTPEKGKGKNFKEDEDILGG